MNFLKRLIPNKYVLMLIFVVVFHVGFNFYWQNVNQAPPTWDSAGHLTLAYIFADKIGYLLKGQLILADLLKTSTYYPPLVPFLGGVTYLLFGRSFEYALLLQTLFFVIAIIYLFLIVKHFFKDNPIIAVFTVLVFSLFPEVWEQSRNYHLDIPLCALLLSAFYHLTLSDSLRSNKHSFLFFLFFSLSQLTKWYGFIFLTVPFFYEVVYKTYTQKTFKNINRIINILFGSLLVMMLAIPWYYLNLDSIVENVKVSSTGDYGDPQTVLSYESLFHYLKLMTSHQLGVLSIIFLMLSLYVMFKKEQPYRKYVSWLLLFPYLIFTLIQNKDLRYILPLTPVIAFVITHYLFSGKHLFSCIKPIIYAIYLFFLFFFLSLNQYTRLPPNLGFVAYLMAGPYSYAWKEEANMYSYNPKNYRIDEIIGGLQKISETSGISANHFKVLTLTDNRYYAVADFDLYALQNKYYNMTIVTPFYQFDPFTPEQLEIYLSDIQFAVVPVSAGPVGLRNIATLNQLISYFHSDQNTNFAKIETYDMPDGNMITTFRRTNMRNYRSPGVKENSLQIYMSNALLLNREHMTEKYVKLHLFNTDGKEKIVELKEGSMQTHISLEGIIRVKIDLSNEYIDPREIRGWISQDGGIFERDSVYDDLILKSGNKFAYRNGTIVPIAKISSFANEGKQKVLVENIGNQVKVSLQNMTDSSYVAYATKGWVWNTVNLTSQNPSVTIPSEGLLQLEVTQKSQLIKNFDYTWTYFICYNGDAICFYPLN